MVLAPALASAQIVPECPPEGCGYPELILLSQNIMTFLMGISVALSAIAFAWAGFLYITARGNQSTLERAHSIFTKVAIGFILVLTAWLIVWLITSTLLQDSYIFLEQ